MKTKVKCPKCGKSFIYNFMPMLSYTTVRLGRYRYMRCPKCGKFGMFNIVKNLNAAALQKLNLIGVAVGIAILLGGFANTLAAYFLSTAALYLSALVLYAFGILTLVILHTFKKAVPGNKRYLN